ncbi:MAG TPA: hypothetical protein VGC32_16545 [Solirubrobacterales bacterium]
MRRLRRLAPLALAFTLAAAALPVTGARADGPRTPTVVARGHSLFGAPWRIKFGEERGLGGEPDHATFLFSVGSRAEQRECECGYYSSIPLPLAPQFVVDPTFGGEFDRFEEGDMSGIAGPHVTRLILGLSDGSALKAELLSPPKRVIEAHPPLGHLRFFDLFFPLADEPLWFAAYGKHDQLFERQSLKS